MERNFQFLFAFGYILVRESERKIKQREAGSIQHTHIHILCQFIIENNDDDDNHFINPGCDGYRAFKQQSYVSGVFDVCGWLMSLIFLVTKYDVSLLMIFEWMDHKLNESRQFY